MQFTLAWRNVWRNPKRTAVILTAVIVGVWTMIFLGAISRGMIGSMIQNSINVLTGHVQIHHAGYRDDPSIDKSMENPEKLVPILNTTLPEGSQWTTRVKAEVVASNARHSGGIVLVGVNFEEENGISFIGNSENLNTPYSLDSLPKNAVLVGQALLKKYETRPGKKLIIMARDKHGEMANRSYRIAGTFRAELEMTEKQFLFVHREIAQTFLNLGTAISEIAISLPDQDESLLTAKAIRIKLGSEAYAVETWRELLPLIDAYLSIWDIIMYLWDLIIFVAMGFGLVNTLLMAVFERIREFGLVRALGMRPVQIVQGVVLESTILLLTGMVIGNTLAILTVWGFSHQGIDLTAFAAGNEMWGGSRIIYPVLAMKDFIVANAMVVVLGLMISLYPAVKAARVTPVEALRQT